MEYPPGLLFGVDPQGRPRVISWDAFENLDIPLSTVFAPLLADDKYFARKEIVPAIPSHTYVIGFNAKGGFLKVDKPLIVQFDSAANDPFPLRARAELNLSNFQFSSIILTAVLANTTIETFVTGRL